MNNNEVYAAADRIGQYIRHTHPWGFRSGHWARVLGVTEKFGRPCYMVAFPDEVCDTWVCADPLEPYEFASQPGVADA